MLSILDGIMEHFALFTFFPGLGYGLFYVYTYSYVSRFTSQQD